MSSGILSRILIHSQDGIMSSSILNTLRAGLCPLVFCPDSHTHSGRDYMQCYFS